MNANHKNNEAVSPVIGVILMISITVILATVIASFIFGMASTQPQPNTVAVAVVKNSPTEGTVTNYGGNGIKALTAPINITVTDGTTTKYYDLGTAVAASTKVTLTAGTQNRILAVGDFGPNQRNILLDVYI